MQSNYFDIFKKCFAQFDFGREEFEALSEIKDCRSFSYFEGGAMAGFALVKGSDLRLLCVLPEYRTKGIGNFLLTQAENHIRSEGHLIINLGGTSSQLFIGATEDSAGFFEKRGYELDGTVAEMGIDTPKLIPTGTEPVNGSICFEYYSGSMDALNRVVAEVDEEWVQYFGDSEIFCAMADGEIASFCTLDEDILCLLSGHDQKIGSIGCVGTVPRFRRRGIGLNMVSRAAEELRARGCGKIFIHYTSVYDWYARLGFKTFLRLRTGGKKLPG